MKTKQEIIHELTPEERFKAYCSGWASGASCRPLIEVYNETRCEKIIAIFNLGYWDGVSARQAMEKQKAKEFGYTLPEPTYPALP